MAYDVKSLRLAPLGAQRIAWAERSMDVLRLIRERFRRTRPLHGIRIAACLHVTTETANLVRTLSAGGADVTLCASNPLSTQDDVAAALVRTDKLPVFAVKGEDRPRYFRHLKSALATKPHVTMDDGADLVSLLHRKGATWKPYGSTEETTTGVIRLRSLERHGLLKFPVIAVNDAETKHLFDNRYGTGQSTIDGILRATNLLLAGKTFVIAGYGWCGRGLATRAAGMGSHVVVTEIEPIRALQAVHDGFRVLPMSAAAKVGDVFVTTTGNRDVIRREHFLAMKDGAIVANAGHFDVEIDLATLRRMARTKKILRPFVVEYSLRGGKRIVVLADGRLVNLASAEGHPPSVMDMSFANQALSSEFLVKHHATLSRKVYSVPKPIDRQIAALKLKAMKVRIDALTPRQHRYLASWEEGT